LTDAGELRLGAAGDEDGLTLIEGQGGGVGGWGDGGLVGDLELADGVGVECGGAVVGEGEGLGEGYGGVLDRGGGVVGEVEIAGEADACGGCGAELSAEVDLGGGEI
jgi:hypothetical protein